QTVAIGQSKIENQRSIGYGQQRGVGLGRRRQNVGLVSRYPQALDQQLGQLLTVFDDQQSHERTRLLGQPLAACRRFLKIELAHDRSVAWMSAAILAEIGGRA